MIQVTFCSKQLFEKKNEVDVSLRLPADAETMKRYLDAAGVRDMDDLLISDFSIHELYAWSCGEYQEWDKADLNELNYLATRLELNVFAGLLSALPEDELMLYRDFARLFFFG